MQKNSTVRVLYLTINPNRQSTTVPTECWFRVLRPDLFPVVVSDKKGDFYKWCKKNRILFYQVPLPFPSKTFPFPFFYALARVLFLIKRHKIQLIHANEHDVAIIAKFASNLAKVPLVISVHCIIPQDYGLWAFKNMKYLRKLYFVSQSTYENSLLALKFISKEKCFILPNCIDINKYYPSSKIRSKTRKYNRLDRYFIVGAAAAIQTIKQLEHIVYAVSQLSDDVVFVLAGGAKIGYEDYARKFLNFAFETLKNRFIYLGHLDNLFEFYNMLDIYLSVSKEEAFPISVLEALSSGCPVISYPSKGALKELINDNVGILVPQDDISALCQAINNLKENPEKLFSMRNNARRFVVENYSMEKISKKLWNDYLEILGS